MRCSGLLHTALIALFFSGPLSAQEILRSQKLKNEISVSKEGDVFMDFKNRQIQKEEVVNTLNASLGFSEQYSFRLLGESKDFLGMEHGIYQQYYLGIPIEEGIVLIHAKDDFLSAINGRVVRVPEQVKVQPALEEKNAVKLAAEELELLPGYSTPEISLVYCNDEVAQQMVLAYKVILEGKKMDSTYTKMQVFIDAQTGKVGNKMSLFAFASTEAQAHTLYSGMQTITTDRYEGGYRLYDSARKITTYNFEEGRIAANGQMSHLLQYTNASTDWGELFALDSVSLLVPGDTALFPGASPWRPQFYAMATDTARYWAQGPITDPLMPSTAPALFGNIGLCLTNSLYTCTIRSSNPRNQQFSGSASFRVQEADKTLGIHDWQDGAGNSGHYGITKQANPALDAHWGMGRTFDYYLETFNRKSYDNRGGAIHNFVNATYAILGTQAFAGALGEGSMIFGLGDRVRSKEYVSLDILAHEYSHMVISKNGLGGLVYKGESGALNESFADIFGACIEFYVKGTKANWQVGEEVIQLPPGFMRSMSNPKATAIPNSTSVGQPDTYKGQYWANADAAFDYGGVHINSGVQNKWFYLLCEGGIGTNDNKDAYQVNGIGMEKAQQIAYRNLTTYLTPYAKYVDAYNGSLKATEDLYGADGPEYKAVLDAWFAVGIGGTTSLPRTLAIVAALNVYPNPASNEINMLATMIQPGKVSVVVTDVLGRIVLRQELGLLVAGDNSVRLDVTSLSPGTYLVTFDAGADKVTTKIALRQ